MPEYEKITFENGFRLLLSEDSRAKSCSMGVWVGSGSCYESDDTAGISHCIEHMVFKGSALYSSEDIASISDRMGGELNAYTDKECTCFYTRVLSADAPAAFELIADMVTSPRLDADDLELEKGVVCEEIAMYESNPADLCADLFYLVAFPEHKLGKNVLGTRDSVNSMTPDMLRTHMDRFYSPASTVACFCGKFERDKIIALCKRYFSSPANKSAIPVLPKADFCPGVHIFDKKTEQNQIVIGFSAPSLGSDSRFACQLIASMLGGSASSRLFRRLREEQGLVYSVDACASSYLSAGVFAVSMGVSRESEKKAVLTATEVLREFPDTVTEGELDLARDHYLSGLIMSLESNSARAARYGTGELLLGGAISEKELEEKIRGVSIDEIRSLARSFSSLSDACICAVGRTAGAKFYNKVVSGKK